MKMSENEFMDWYWTKASSKEKQLFDRLNDFGEMFEDMLFKPDTPSYELIKCKSKSADSDEWIDDETPLPDELEYFSYTFFRVAISDNDDVEGSYDSKEQVITLSRQYADSEHYLLHEMIHLHEDIINDLPMYYHDTLLWTLYYDLKKKIDGLDEAITQHAHLLNEWSIYRYGGLHDVLFLLKSFDLDIRMGYPLGTVLGYSGVDEFKYLKYNQV